jgi:chromosome segregation ATPase
MVKRYLTLAILLLLSYVSLSQIDTSNICFPYNIVQKISIELIQKDSLESELHETQKLIQVFKSKVEIQDSIISTQNDKESNLLGQIQNLSEQDEIHTKEVKRLRSENNTLNRKNKNLKTTTKILGGGLLGTIVLLIVLI